MMSLSFEKRVQEIEALSDGWNGENSYAIHLNAIKIVKSVLKHTWWLDSPEIGAVEDGSLDLNWITLHIYCIFDDEEAHVQWISFNSLTEPSKSVVFQYTASVVDQIIKQITQWTNHDE